MKKGDKGNAWKRFVCLLAALALALTLAPVATLAQEAPAPDVPEQPSADVTVGGTPGEDASPAPIKAADGETDRPGNDLTPQEADGVEARGASYSEDDIEMVWRIDAFNKVRDPTTWDFATWNDETPKRLIALDFSGWDIDEPFKLEPSPSLGEMTYHKLQSLDFSGSSFSDISIGGMPELTSIDVTGAKMEQFTCIRTAVEELDLSTCKKLVYAECTDSKLNRLTLPIYSDGGDEQPLLWLDCRGNNLQTLDLPDTYLMQLDCSDNLLTQITGLENQSLLTDLDCSGNRLTSLTLDGFDVLTDIDCSNNSLASLTLKNLPDLSTLSCTENPFETLDVAGLDSLRLLDVRGGKLKTLDISGLSLFDLNCAQNELTSITLGPGCVMQLNCQENKLKTLDISDASGLTTLWCAQNGLQTLKTGANTTVREIDCSQNKLKTLDLSQNTALKSLSCYGNELDGLDLHGLTALEEVSCYGNNLGALDVSDNGNVHSINCANNQIGALAVNHLDKLKLLNCSDNDLESLDVSNLSKLEELFCANNHIGSIDGLQDTTSLETLDFGNNKVSLLDTSALANLRTLIASENRLTSIGNLSVNTPLLERLECSKNRVAQINLYGLADTLYQADFSSNEVTDFTSVNGVRVRAEATGPGGGFIDGWDIDTDKITLVAKPDSGARFTGWQAVSPAGLEVTETADGAYFTLAQDSVVRAAFADRYELTSAPDAYTGDGKGRRLVVDAPFDHYVKTTVNGGEVPVLAERGSTVVTFPASYLDTLESGSYDIRVSFTDGYADAKLTVDRPEPTPTPTPTATATPTPTPTPAPSAQPTPMPTASPAPPSPAPTAEGTQDTSPKTGDSADMALWIVLLAVSGAGIAGLAIISRRKKAKDR